MIHNILNKYWKFQTFRDPQKEVINAVIQNRDVLALLPTGAGKSLCFQIPAMAKKGICIVISPLVALMEDQVNNLQKKGIKAIALTSKFNMEDTIQAFDNLQYGNYKFLYLSPEKLQSDFIQEKIGQLEVNCIAIDEAHCISQWGHDFRPAYLKLTILRKIHPNTNIIALSGSATSKVINDIIKQLNLRNEILFKKSFARKNLSYHIIKTENSLGKLKQILLKIKEPAIVYTKTRKNSIDISNNLNQIGFKSTYYHGGLKNNDKIVAFENWMNERTPIMVATNAFGMGIDKSNVRVIIHMHIPDSVEQYIQEVGRAGRDDTASFAFMIYNESSIYNCRDYLLKRIATTQFHKQVYRCLNAFYQIGTGEYSEKSYTFNLQDFCNINNLDFLKTIHVLYNLNQENIIEVNQNINKKSSLKIIVSNSYLFDYEYNNPKLYRVLKEILRNYGGAFDQFISINESLISKKLFVEKSTIVQSLIQLDRDKIIIYNQDSDDAQLKFLTVREDNFIINNISSKIEQRNRIKIQKVNTIIKYVQNDSICRNIQLLNYFGEKSKIACGNCDVCRRKKNNIKFQNIAKEFLDLFIYKKQISFEELESQLNHDKENIMKTLELLVEKNKLRLTSRNKIELVNN